MKTLKNRNGSAGKVVLIVLAVILIIVAVSVAVVYCVFKVGYFDKAHYVEDDGEYTVLESLPPEVYVDANGNQQTVTESPLDPDQAQALRQQLLDGINAARRALGLAEIGFDDLGSYENLANNSQVKNILLIGVDRRDSGWAGNSDSMILLSINKEKKTVHMTSFLRDLSANIPGIGVKKLNAACAHGGARLLVDTIENNYAISIDNYIMVDFNAMIQVVDAVGGIDMEVTDAETQVSNGYIREMCRLYGADPADHLFNGGGSLHLDGYQAVAYARNRYTGNTYDFGRTQRQRNVLMAILNKAKSGGIGSINSAVQTVLPYVTHNIDQMKLITLIAQMPEIMNYKVEEDHIPYDGMYHNQGEMLVPDMEATISRLHSSIY